MLSAVPPLKGVHLIKAKGWFWVANRAGLTSAEMHGYYLEFESMNGCKGDGLFDALSKAQKAQQQE